MTPAFPFNSQLFKLKQLLRPSSSTVLANYILNSNAQVRHNAWRASIGKIARSKYVLCYPIKVVRPDGSTLEMRASEPQQIVQLAVDLKALTEDERRQRLAARKPKAKKIEEEIIDDNFDEADYLNYFSGDSRTTLKKKNAQ